jgi:spermidine/putrescine transport system ATP-binding protein
MGKIYHMELEKKANKMEKKVIVKLDHYYKSYGLKKVINNLNLEVYEGEFLTLLGSSGCGKTTILRSIAGIDSVTSGKIFIDGIDVTEKSPIARPVNTLFQNYALFPNMTVEQNIGFGLKMKKVPKAEIKKRVNDMLQLVELEGYENRKPVELSGGEQQRVSIARGIINNPKVLLLDEPLSALDLKLRKQMQVELKMLQKRLGITFIYVTHNQEEALTMSDRIVLLHNGKIEQLDTPYNIYRHPKTKYVADFIGDSNIFDAKVIEIKNGIAYFQMGKGIIKVEDNGYHRYDNVFLVFRPEDLIVTSKKLKYNMIKATVIENIYNGSFTRLIMKMDNHSDIKINVDGMKNYQVGDVLNLTWDEEEAIIIRDDIDEKI